MKIALLDPGLKSLAGHHFDLDLRLLGALVRRGHSVEVHGHARPDPTLVAKAEQAGMRLHATFRVSPYRPPPQEVSPADAYRTLEQATATDLATVASADLWLWPTLLPYQLAAAIGHADAVRQIGGVWALPRRLHPQGAQSWSASAGKLAGAPHRIVVGAYDELLCRGYQEFVPGLQVELVPCPHDGAPNERSSGELRRIGFFGHQRAGRGIELMPALVDALLARGFEVVVQDSSARLRRRGNSDRIELLERVEDFPAELARCDVVIWPSRWESYTQSLSGVVSEAIASGVPVVVPSGCIPAQIVARHRCGVFFHDHCGAAILEALAQAETDFPRLRSRAREAASTWRVGNGTGRLVEWIEQRVGAMR